MGHIPRIGFQIWNIKVKNARVPHGPDYIKIHNELVIN